jgi:hypothetical protein
MHPPFLLGLVTGGAVIYWFTGASMQAVTTGAYRAVEFIKKNIKLEGVTKASVEDSKKVVEICTIYAQKGMFNIFIGVFCFTLAFAFFSAPQGTNYTPTAFTQSLSQLNDEDFVTAASRNIRDFHYGSETRAI